MKRGKFSLLLAAVLIVAGMAAGDTLTIGPYAYDGGGNITAIGNDVYLYDAFGRLIYGTAGSRYQHYTYDAFGNLLTIATDQQTNPQQEFGVDRQTNRLTDTSKSIYASYDTAGRGQVTSLSVAGTSFTYDSAGMISKSTVDGVTKVHIYTASDERLGSVVVNANNTPAQRTWTPRDVSGRVLRIVESNGVTQTWKEDYIYRGTQLLASELPGGRTQHFHPDHLGTPRLITDETGRQISRHTYYPFGTETPETRATNAERMKFTGHERDHGSAPGTDLDYMHARYYSPVWGRFLSVDPVLDVQRAMRTPQLWNRYSYVLNNPINRIDPDGTTDGCPTCKTEAEEEAVRRAAAGGDEFASMRLGETPQGLVDKGIGPLEFLAFGLATSVVRSGSRTAAQTLFQGGVKGDVLSAVRGGAGQMTGAQRTTLVRHLQRATTKESITVTRNANGTLTVLKTRPGADGAQTIVTQIGRDGTSSVVQTANNAAGRLVHYDPKSNPSLWDRIKSLFY